MSDAKIIQTLSPTSWKDNPWPPHRTAPVHVKNRLVERTWPYVDQKGHDYTGTDYEPMDFELPFVNGINQAPPKGYKRWFPEYFEACKPDFATGTAGDLQHPLLGSVRARVETASWDATDACLGGVIVKVKVVVTNEDPSTDQFFGVVTANQDPARLAATAQTAADEFDVMPAPDRPAIMMQQMYGVAVTNPGLNDIWAAISTLIFALDIGAEIAVSSLIGDVDVMISTLEAMDDAMAYQALDACQKFRLYLGGALLTLAQANRPTGSKVVTQRTTLDAFAKTVGNTLADVIGLNLTLVKRPFIERAKVRYYLAA